MQEERTPLASLATIVRRAAKEFDPAAEMFDEAGLAEVGEEFGGECRIKNAECRIKSVFHVKKEWLRAETEPLIRTEE